jgi:hypothetical protein
MSFQLDSNSASHSASCFAHSASRFALSASLFSLSAFRFASHSSHSFLNACDLLNRASQSCDVEKPLDLEEAPAS